MATKAEKLLAKGKTLEAKGKREKALELYRDACRAEPYDPDLWTARGDAANAAGLRGEAAESLFHVCELYARGGLPAQALPVVKRVLALDPGHGGARRLRGVLEQKLGIDSDEPEPGRAAPTPTPAPRVATTPGPAPAAGATASVAAATPAPASAAAATPAPASAAAATPAPAPAAAATPAPAPSAAGAPAAAAASAPSAAAAPPAPVAPAPMESRPGVEDFEEELQELGTEPAPPAPQPPPPPPVPVASAASPSRPSAPVAVPPRLPSEPHRRVPSEPPPPPPVSSRAPSRPPIADAHAAPALDELSLAERLAGAASQRGGSHEIALDESGHIDVVHAVASTLSSSPLLSELDSDLVRHLIEVGKLVHRNAEDPVFRQGDPGSSLFLVLAGEVTVVHESRPGPARELARLRPGAFFGEMALLTNTPRTASVIATRHSDFLEISRRAVRELIDHDPRILKLLMRFFRARLVGTLLQTSPLFKPFSRDERRDLVARFRLRELPADHAVITEGEPGDGLFIVLVGQLDVLQTMATSHRKGAAGDGLAVLLGTLVPGDVFGEMSLLGDTGAVATVRTRARAWVLLLPRADFKLIAEQHPHLRAQLEELAAARREHNLAASQEARETRVDPV
jgi:CRP-like cAMP-binding protein